MKKLISLIAMFFMTLSVYSYELPHSFWAINEWYTSALDSGDVIGIISSAKQILQLLDGEEENEQTINIKASRNEQIALAYEKLKDYNTSAFYFSKYLEYAKLLGWDDAVKICNAKILQYTTDIRIYKNSNVVNSYHGAKLEEQKGVYYGITSDSSSIDLVPNASMVLLYTEFGDDNLSWINKVLSDAADSGRAVEFAWNLPGEGSQIGSVTENSKYIIDVLNLIEKYNSVPVFLRFGAEVNIWEDRADKNSYIEAFRFISNLSKQYTTNTAMVWSVNTVSSWDIEMNDYYPGDEFVDWVGVSLYAKKYFLGKNDWSESERFNEVVFQTGVNSDPVKSLNEIISKYGSRKPIMIAESGAAHTTRSLNEYDFKWASNRLKQLYWYVPMVYPQVKLIAHFDKVISSEINDYSITNSKELLDLYLNLTQQKHFLHLDKTGSCITYKEVYDSSNVSTKNVLYVYPHIYGEEDIKINYYVDDKLMDSIYEYPYEFKGLNQLAEGIHKLTIVAENKNETVAEKTIFINVEKEIVIFVNGKEIDSDVAPITKNDRTLVPVRVIAEGLGANVDWDEATSTVYISKDGHEIKLEIGNNVLIKDNQYVTMDTLPIIENNRTMVPIRAISESLNAVVDWDEDNKFVIINNEV